MSYCLMFPGQGTQFPGMGCGLDLNGVVGPGLLALMMDGPEDELNRTTNAQPAVLAASIALWNTSKLSLPDVVMGHSLGEYTALVVSGALSLKDAISLVGARASFMEEAQPGHATGMAAVIGLALEKVEEVILDVDDVWVANINGGGQVVISGKLSSIDKAVPRLKTLGARRVINLKVSVASHCPLMKTAAAKLMDSLKSIDIKKPRCPVIFNATARPESDPEKIREILSLQLVEPVRWEGCVEKAISMDVDEFIEIGPKSVLAPLVKRIAKGVSVEAKAL